MNVVKIIGGGLAGCEAAYALANRGIAVDLYEMRPIRTTEAHKTDRLAELVCSNSFKSLNPVSAPGILKQELRLLGSLSIQCAEKAQVSAGGALAVDREIFSAEMTKAISSHPLITLHREEINTIPQEGLAIIATGPLTSPALTEAMQKITGQEKLYFYDAISPIVDASTIDFSKAFFANRYQKSSNKDYINCPFSKEDYEQFINALLMAERMEAKAFEKMRYYEACMPIEEMLDRGRDTLRFGPMKPVGIFDPHTNKRPYAVVQLRAENASQSAFNIVGFQTKLKYFEQKKVFQMIPGLEKAEFLRLGSMHRNTFVDSPRVLNPDLSLKNAPAVMLAGQITGVEGYLESASIGLLAGRFAAAKILGAAIPYPPEATAIGALLRHLHNTKAKEFQPMGINFGLFNDESIQHLQRDQKRQMLANSALQQIQYYISC